MTGVAALSILAAALICSGAPITPPDTSLSTLPVAYYGANWNRTAENMEVLSKMQIVILMQEDGPCWVKCCPHARDPSNHLNQCGDPHGKIHNATTLPGCGPECDQHGSQNKVFEKLKTLSKQSGRPDPHCMLYLNSVYDFPFSSTAALGNKIDVLNINGQPHVENVDPGLFPVTFFDYSKPPAVQAWLDIVKRAVLQGSADGVYVDCGGTYGLKCDTNGTNCIAKRNGKVKSLNEHVTPAQTIAYQKAKDDTMVAGSKILGPSGSWYSKAGRLTNSRLGGNLWMMKAVTDAPKMIQMVQDAFKKGGYKYLIVGCENCFSNPKVEQSSLPSHCSETQIAVFLLAVEPGSFLLCNGWDNKFALPLGLPKGPATLSTKTGVWSRSFAGGTAVTWVNNTGHVKWAAPSQLDSAFV